MCIDNFAVSHGRQPTYDLGRKILVAWSEALDKTTLQDAPTEEVAAVEDKAPPPENAHFRDMLVPDAIAVTPDTTPNSTLTNAEAEDLREFISSNVSVQQIIGNESVVASSKASESLKCNLSCPAHIDDIFS